MSRRGITLGILDDHQVLLDGLTAWLSDRTDDIEVAIACRTWPALLTHERFPVHVVLLDLELDDELPAAAKIATLHLAGVATVVVSTRTEPALVRECLSMGALGFVPKRDDAGAILEAVRSAHRGGPYLSASATAALIADNGRAPIAPQLSEQERRVLILYASGLPMKTVARRLDVSYETAKSYLGRVRDKYAACGRATGNKIDLCRRAVEDGLISGR